jgi:anti-sigma-K factor RskA
MRHDQMFEFVSLYALDALEGEEREAFEAHLADCAECRAELAVHRSTVTAMVPDGPAPAGVWDRIAAEIGAPAGPAGEAVDLDARRSRSGRRFAWLAGVAAVVALVFGAVAVFEALEVNELTGPDAVVAAAEAAADEPGSIVAVLDSDDGVVAQVVLTSDGEGFLIPASMETLGDDRTYQLWVITPEEAAISAGVLGNEPAPARFTWSGDVAGFALTREVAGGVESSAGDVVSVVEL